MKLMSVLFLLIAFPVQDISQIRENYFKASETKEKAEGFYGLVLDYHGEDELLLAYKGAGLTLKAKYSSNLFSKKKYFTDGVELIESSVKYSPENPEIRIIRLSIQEHTPKILNYNNKIEEDKKVILDFFDSQSPVIKNHIRTYVRHSEAFHAEEKARILQE